MADLTEEELATLVSDVQSLIGELPLTVFELLSTHYEWMVSRLRKAARLLPTTARLFQGIWKAAMDGPSPRPLMDEEDLEASKGMNLDGIHPKESVNHSLGALLGTIPPQRQPQQKTQRLDSVLQQSVLTGVRARMWAWDRKVLC